jgi:pimeloyl-ACP methyl ester carboxylesterase
MLKCFKEPVFKIIQNSGHLSNLENPGVFNKAVLEFLKKV